MWNSSIFKEYSLSDAFRYWYISVPAREWYKYNVTVWNRSCEMKPLWTQSLETVLLYSKKIHYPMPFYLCMQENDINITCVKQREIEWYKYNVSVWNSSCEMTPLCAQSLDIYPRAIYPRDWQKHFMSKRSNTRQLRKRTQVYICIYTYIYTCR